MTKYELEEIKDEYDLIKAKEEAKKYIDRLICISEVNKVKDYAEKVYKDNMEKHWGFFYGMRDNIHDMADNLADMQQIDKLQYFNLLMYGILLNNEPRATEGLHTMTQPMNEALLKHLLKEGVA